MENFVELSFEEQNMVDGGAWYDAVLTSAGGVMTTLGVCSLISGSSVASIATMGVGSLAACGPVGWAILGVAVVGGAATGFATVAAARK